MKKLLITTTATLLCVGVFGQGKLAFINNTTRLIYFTTDTNRLVAADANKSVGGFPLAGSGLYTGSGSTIAALEGSPTIIAALYGGTSSSTLSLLTTTTIDDYINEGQVVNKNLTLNGFAAGVPAWFQVQIFDSRASASAPVVNGYGGGAADAWAHFDQYAGASQIFQANPQAAVYTPIYLTSAPVNSTWAAGTFALVDYPGTFGAIEVYANPGPPPPQPQILSQPTSATNYLGQSVTFTVTASGDPPLSYQWQANGTNLSDGPNISGAATRQLILGAITLADAGSYRVIITNYYGSVTSSNAYLTIYPSGVFVALHSGITIEGAVGLTYGIRYSTDLSNTNGWQGLANVTLSAPTELWLDAQPATRQQRYYLVVPGPIPIP